MKQTPWESFFSAFGRPKFRASSRTWVFVYSPIGKRVLESCSWLSSQRKYDWSFLRSTPLRSWYPTSPPPHLSSPTSGEELKEGDSWIPDSGFKILTRA